MLYLLIILFAVWNGFVIKWKDSKEWARRIASSQWHTTGFWVRISLVLMVLILHLPEEHYKWVLPWICPALIFGGWIGAAITTITAIIFSYWIYNLIINKINGWKWDYLGKGDYGDMWYVGSFILAGFLLLVLVVIAIEMTY